MTHEAPSSKSSLLARLGAAIRYVLRMEPVAVAAVWRGIVVLVGAAGLVVPDVIDARVGAVIVAFYALVELVTTIRARSRSAAWASVVEQERDGVVVAGPANDLRATGAVVRTIA